MAKAKRQVTKYTMRSNVRTLSLKFYAEQALYPAATGQTQNDAGAAKEMLKKRIEAVDKGDIQILAIMHDRDPKGDDIWHPSIEKPHFHVILRVVGRPVVRRVGQLLELMGVTFRQDPDENGEPVDRKLWEKHGVETVKKFANYAMYLTHETAEAIADGKELYELDEIFSNLEPDEIKLIRAGYVDPSRVKVTVDDMSELDKTAYQMGYEMQNFTSWYRQLPFEVRSLAKMRTVRESYNLGVDARIEDGTEVVRLCIFIQGKPGVGKTYAAKGALTCSGKSVLNVSGGESGRFDSLRPDHDAIVIDDDVCPNLLIMSDNYICRAYRRNRNNPAWAGRYLVVTSNLDFDGWMEACGISEEHRDAVRSRFYICRLKKTDGVNCLDLEDASRRGTEQEQRERLDMFCDFRAKFDDIIRQYKPGSCDIDYDYIEGRYFKVFERGQEIVRRAREELEYYKRSQGFGQDAKGTTRYIWDFPAERYMGELEKACGSYDADLGFFTGCLGAVEAEWDSVNDVVREQSPEREERPAWVGIPFFNPAQQPGIPYQRN